MFYVSVFKSFKPYWRYLNWSEPLRVAWGRLPWWPVTGERWSRCVSVNMHLRSRTLSGSRSTMMEAGQGLRYPPRTRGFWPDFCQMKFAEGPDELRTNIKMNCFEFIIPYLNYSWEQEHILLSHVTRGVVMGYVWPVPRNVKYICDLVINPNRWSIDYYV